jgi:hypothetical protein
MRAAQERVNQAEAALAKAKQELDAAKKRKYSGGVGEPEEQTRQRNEAAFSRVQDARYELDEAKKALAALSKKAGATNPPSGPPAPKKTLKLGPEGGPESLQRARAFVDLLGLDQNDLKAEIKKAHEENPDHTIDQMVEVAVRRLAAKALLDSEKEVLDAHTEAAVLGADDRKAIVDSAVQAADAPESHLSDEQRAELERARANAAKGGGKPAAPPGGGQSGPTGAGPAPPGGGGRGRGPSGGGGIGAGGAAQRTEPEAGAPGPGQQGSRFGLPSGPGEPFRLGGGQAEPGEENLPQAPAPPARLGGGQEVLGVQQGETGYQTALAYQQIDSERAKRGEPPIAAPAYQDNPTTWKNALATLERNPNAGRDLVEELNKRPRATSVDEQALLLAHKIATRNEFETAFARHFKDFAFRRGASAAEADASLKRVQGLMDHLTEIEKAARASGTELGRAFQFRRQLANEDYGLEGMLRSYQSAKGGELTEADMETIRGLHEQITALRQRADEAELALARMEKRQSDETPEQAGTRVGTSPEWKEFQTAKAQRAQGEDQFRSLLARAKAENKPWVEKIPDWFQRYIRFNIFSSPKTLLKLASAATENVLVTPFTEMVISGLKKIPGVGGVLEKSPRYGGGFSWDTTKKAIMSVFSEGARDAVAHIQYGQSALEAQHGGEVYSRGLAEPTLAGKILDMPGNIHAALKSFAKRAEYTNSFLARMRHSAKIGEDATDPQVMQRNSALAYLDGEAAILMNKNIVSQAWQKAIQVVERGGVMGRAAGMFMRATMPVVRVPTNLVARTLEYSFGSITGSIRLGVALGRGVERLQPDQADLIARQLGRGAVGGALLIAGYFLGPKVVGGFFQSERERKPGEREPMQIGVLPGEISHHPATMALQLGATFRREQQHAERGVAGAVGGTVHAALELMGELPMARGARNVAGLVSTNAYERGRAMGDYLRELSVPSLATFMGERLDAMQSGGGPFGRTPHRVPRTVGQRLEMAVPGLRRLVPLATR